MMKFDFPGPGAGFSLHNHSNWSDGASPLDEVCRAGKAAGLQVFGISDHWVVPPSEGYDSESWSMKLDRLDDYVAALQKLKGQLDDENFSLKIGLEVDFFFENISDVLANLKNYPLDYLIGSVHYSGKFPIDYDISSWNGLSESDKDEICEIYWQKLLGAAQVEEFTFIGHLDLPKKFALIDNEKYLPHAEKVLDALALHHGAIELNTAGWFKPYNEQYPALPMLTLARQRNIPVIVNSDSHSSGDVIREFGRAYGICDRAGYSF